MDTIRKTLFAASLALISASAHAAGLGKLTVFSALGQPFSAEIELVAVTKEETLTLSGRLAPPEAFKEANIDYASSLLGIKFKVEKVKGGDQLILRMSSTGAINEPFLDMLVELDWAGGRLVREYTTLLDPPGYTTATPAPVAAAPVVTAVQPPVVSAPQAPPPVEARPLAPVAEPRPEPVAPPAAAAPAPPPAESKAPAKPAAKPANDTYEVKRGDTLRKIADQNRVDGVTTDQMLMALYRANQDAFIGSNMNRMRAGAILQIPDRDEALATGEADARRLVVAQAVDFNAYRRQLAGAVEKTPAAEAPAAAQSAKGKITPKVEDQAAATKPGADQLKLSKADDAGKAAVAAKGDDKTAKSNATKEAASRAAALEKIKETQQKLLDLKNKEAADLAAKAAEKKAEEQKAADAKKAAAEQKVADQKAAVEQKAAAGEKAAADQKSAAEQKAAADQKTASEQKAPPATADTKTDAAKSDAAKSAEADTGAKTDEKKKSKKRVPPPPPPEPGIMDMVMDNILYIGVGVVLVLAVVVGVVMVRRRKTSASSRFEDSIITGGDLKANSVFANTGGQSVDTGGSSLQSISSDSPGGPGDSDEVDPIAEADVYMAYGRDSQAEEILKEALAKDPSRQTIRAKLLEIYFARKDVKTFESVARELHAATGGSGPEWAKAAELGTQLDPANSLYGGQGVPTIAAAAAPSPEDTVVMHGQMPTEHAPEAEHAPEETQIVETGAAEDIIDLSAPVEEPSAAEAAPAQSLDMDFDLDLGDGAAPAAAPAAPTAADGGLDFDLGGEGAPALTESSTIQFSAPTIEAPPASQFDDAATVMMPSGTATVIAPPEPPKKAAMEVAPMLPDDEESDDDHMKTIVVDFNMADEPRAAGGNGAGGAVQDARWQEVATKLDLAKAYEEMGDKDGTRELLNEVLKEGDMAQQDQARSILSRLG